MVELYYLNSNLIFETIIFECKIKDIFLVYKSIKFFKYYF